MDWYKSRITNFVSSLKSVIVTNSVPSVLYQIKTAPSPSILLAVQLHNIEAIVPDNVSLAQLRIRASKFLIAQIAPILHRLECYLSDHNRRSQVLRERFVILRLPRIAEAEQLDTLSEVVQNLIDCLHSFVGLHVQASNAIRLSLRSNRSDDLAHAIVATCRQADALYHAVQSSSSVAELRYSLAEMLRKSCAVRDASDHEHIAGQLDQFWNQNHAENRFGAHDVRITLRLIQRELTELEQLKIKFEEIVCRELSPPWGFMRHPVRYAGLACVTAYASHVFAAHSRFLGGSGMLEDGIMDKLEALKLFAVMNIIEPAFQLYEQVFLASPVTANEESIAASRSAVRDLLIDFTKKHLPEVPGALELAENGSMKAMFDLIRTQAGTPVRSLLQGSLAQAMLIQIQKLKCDVEELMVKTKQTLRAQELNLALLALVPSLLAGAAVTHLLSAISFHWRNRGRDVIVASGQTAKFLLEDIQHSLLSLECDTKKGHDCENVSSLIRYAQNIGIIHVKLIELDHLIRSGSLPVAPEVLLRFQKDLEILQEAESTVEAKRRHVKMMLACYTFLINR